MSCHSLKTKTLSPVKQKKPAQRRERENCVQSFVQLYQIPSRQTVYKASENLDVLHSIQSFGDGKLSKSLMLARS